MPDGHCYSFAYRDYNAGKVCNMLIHGILCTYFFSGRLSFAISSNIPAVIIPAGKATMAMPKTDDIMVIILPMVVMGYISPYPTVVKETVAQYTASK